MTDIRQASLEPGSGERLPGVLAQVGPFFILLLGALWLYRRFEDLPARIERLAGRCARLPSSSWWSANTSPRFFAAESWPLR